MKRKVFYLVAALTAAVIILLVWHRSPYSTDEAVLANGKILFAKHCASCHGLREDGIGPPLGGVTASQSKLFLTTFIRDPGGVISGGHERMVRLHNRYKLLMPNFDWMSEDQVHGILSYINHQSTLLHIDARVTEGPAQNSGITGRLVDPVQPSPLRVQLTEVVRLPMIGSTTDLGVVTVRAHPSGDGTLYAGDQNGVIYRISDGAPSIYLDLRKEVPDFQSGPGIATGLGSFAFHPDFLNNGLIYITHAETYKGQNADYTAYDSARSEVQWIIGEWKASDVNAETFSGTHRELLRTHAPTFGHGCQEIAFVPGLAKGDPNYGLLYIGYGDGGSNNIKRPDLGHQLRSFLGTILRIDPAGNNSPNGRYGIPPDNPFVNDKDPKTIREIYAYGFRNPHRMSWDPDHDNRMLATDIGESNIEELNVIIKGGDYGWPAREGTFGIITAQDLKTVVKLPPDGESTYRNPFAQYDHEDGNAISGGYVYNGRLSALWHKYIFGDIVSGRLFFVNMDSLLSDSAVYEIRIDDHHKETTLREMSNNRRIHLRIAYDPYRKDLYVVTKINGKIFKITDAFGGE